MNHQELRQQVEIAIGALEVPELGVTLLDIANVHRCEVNAGALQLELGCGIPLAGLQPALAGLVWGEVREIAGVESLQLDLVTEVVEAPVVDASKRVEGVSNIIAVASGKGGVGKSTTAVNLALALAAEGARVGILDADIYGPSIPAMLGVSGRPEVVDNKFMKPVLAHGIYAISMGLLVTEETPMAWRGPMASGALQQLLRQTHWPDVDYLIIDMPPGTGDIQLTLAQTVPVSGAVIVSTPQDIALLDARKGIEMFRKVDVPVLGVVENMSLHICSQCGHQEAIFGTGGGERIAADYQTSLLGQLPLTLSIREQADAGRPTVAADPDGEVSQLYRAIARRTALTLQQRSVASVMPRIEVSDD